jgi:hypothetical protein
MKFRKKPIIVEAYQVPPGMSGVIDTIEGGMAFGPGDWMVTGIQGEQYPVKDDIFRETYTNRWRRKTMKVTIKQLKELEKGHGI